MKKIFVTLICLIILLMSSFQLLAQQISYPIVDTNQGIFYDNADEISVPQPGDPFYGQDAQFDGNQPDYTDNGDGTITDNVTGLMWSKTCDVNNDGVIDYEDKLTYDEAVATVSNVTIAGYTDWRLPTIKELYSLIIFSGLDCSGWNGSTNDLVPFIDTDYFDFGYGDESAGERIIDAQFVTKTLYVSTTMNGNATMFGVNFADGRIKGYPYEDVGPSREAKKFYVYYVRGTENYGMNDFEDNGNGTITDIATGLMWSQNDSGEGLNWEEALFWVQQKNSENYLGYNDWRLPNVKELQSIVDYTRSPATTNSAAIDPLFNVTSITNAGGEIDYPFFWSGTTHANMNNGEYACYVSFGRALGWMEIPPYSGNYALMDVHGAGAQRSDPKSGDPANWPHGHGPQGDVIRIYNYVRLVRDATTVSAEPQQESSSRIKLHKSYPNPAKGTTQISFSSKTQITQPEITIYNLIGQKLATLSCEEENSEDGYRFYVDWNCTSDNGEEVPSGVYLYNVSVNNSIIQTDKLMIMR